jgi:hypothetical protein
MQAIKTAYYGPTDRRGSRMIASLSDGRRVKVEYDHGLDLDGNHRKACEAMMARMGWTFSPMIGGGWKGDMVWVFRAPLSPVAEVRP